MVGLKKMTLFFTFLLSFAPHGNSETQKSATMDLKSFGPDSYQLSEVSEAFLESDRGRGPASANPELKKIEQKPVNLTPPVDENANMEKKGFSEHFPFTLSPL